MYLTLRNSPFTPPRYLHTPALWSPKPFSFQPWGERTFPVLEQLLSKNIPMLLERYKPGFKQQELCKKTPKSSKTPTLLSGILQPQTYFDLSQVILMMLKKQQERMGIAYDRRNMHFSEKASIGCSFKENSLKRVFWRQRVFKGILGSPCGNLLRPKPLLPKKKTLKQNQPTNQTKNPTQNPPPKQNPQKWKPTPLERNHPRQKRKSLSFVKLMVNICLCALTYTFFLYRPILQFICNLKAFCSQTSGQTVNHMIHIKYVSKTRKNLSINLSAISVSLRWVRRWQTDMLGAQLSLKQGKGILNSWSKLALGCIPRSYIQNTSSFLVFANCFVFPRCTGWTQPMFPH